MAIIKSKTLKGSDSGELNSKLKDLRLELMKFSAQRSSKSVSNPGKLKEVRRSIAKILTELNFKKIAKEKGKEKNKKSTEARSSRVRRNTKSKTKEKSKRGNTKKK